MYIPVPNDLSKDVVLGSSRYVWAKVKSVPDGSWNRSHKPFPFCGCKSGRKLLSAGSQKAPGKLSEATQEATCE